MKCFFQKQNHISARGQPLRIGKGVLEKTLRSTFSKRTGTKTSRDHHSHSHKSSATDEGKILRDLCDLKPFTTVPNRKHDSFPDIVDDPLSTLKEEEFDKWVARHRKNLLLDAPFEQEAEEE